jgi:hypothetical protein
MGSKAGLMQGAFEDALDCPGERADEVQGVCANDL